MRWDDDAGDARAWGVRLARGCAEAGPHGATVAGGSGSALVIQSWPQGNGYADADRDDEEQSDCETDEKAAHGVSFALRRSPIPLFPFLANDKPVRTS